MNALQINQIFTKAMKMRSNKKRFIIANELNDECINHGIKVN